jgi:Ca2+-binding RTX toxin-like protein
VGSDLTARNLLLTQNGADLEITFEGVADTKVTLQNFPLENLENLTDLGNILFNGQNSIQDSFDVVNADFKQPRIFNRNTVTFLNDLNNNILGFDNSNDVINGQGGDDTINGLSGNDLLRGGEGSDLLFGGTGSDILVGGFGDDILDLGVDRDQDTVVYRSGDGSDTVRNFNRGRGGDLLDFQNIPAIDVAVNGNSTFFRLSDGIQGNEGFGTDDPFLRLSGTTGFTPDNLGQNLVAGNTTQFLFA